MADSILSEKQQRFVEEYLRDRNASAAYLRAGYSAKNDNTAAACSSRLLRDAKVAAAIEARLQPVQKAVENATELTVARVVKGLLREAELHGEGSSPSARVSAWKALGDHLRMFEKKPDPSGGQTLILTFVEVRRAVVSGSLDGDRDETRRLEGPGLQSASGPAEGAR